MLACAESATATPLLFAVVPSCSNEHSQDATVELTCRLATMAIAMDRHKIVARVKERRCLLGIRLTAALKTIVKVEAARRRLMIARFFGEMWQGYLEHEHAGAR